MLDAPALSSTPPSLPRALTAMTGPRVKSVLSKLHLRKGEAVDTLLRAAIEGLEASKDAITAAAPVPGLSIVLDIVTELLKKIQVRPIRL